MFNPTTAQRVNERYRRLLLGSGWTLPESGAELTLNYDFVAQPNLGPQINPFTGAPAGPTLDITRTTTKTFSDWESVLRTVVAGEASFTGCRRVENRLVYSSRLDKTPEWGTTNASITVNAIMAPDGTMTADLLVEDTADGVHRVSQAEVIANGNTWTASSYIKAGGGRDRVALRTTSSSTKGYIFDAASGTAIAAFGIAPDSFGIEDARITFPDAPDGWYRIWVTLDVNFGAGETLGWQLIESGTTTSYEGDGVSGTYIWGAQSEIVSGQADTSPSEYQATTAVAVARTYPLQKNGLPLPSAIIGLLPEESRTNLLTRSEEFDHADWTKTNSTISANATTAPDGTLTADKLVSASGTVNPRIANSQDVVNGTKVTQTIYVKSSEASFIQMTPSTRFPLSPFQNFDIAGVALGTSADIDGASIKDVGNGWIRCSITDTPSSTGAGIIFITLQKAADDNRLGTNSWNGTDGIFVWGAQLETGLFPTSYIPTVGSTVTRNEDDVTTTDISWFNNANPGTFYAHASKTDGTGINHRVFSIRGDVNNRLVLFDAADGYRAFHLEDAVIDQITSTNVTPSDDKLAFGYDATDIHFFINGVDKGSTGPLVPLDISSGTLQIGGEDSTSLWWDGHVAQLRYYNKKATPSELGDLSSGLLSP